MQRFISSALGVKTSSSPRDRSWVFSGWGLLPAALPSAFRIYARHGVQAMFVPSAWPASRRKHWELFITARACENQMFVTGINTNGTTPVDSYAGESLTADPNGTIIARAREAEQLLFCDLDPALVESIRTAFPVARDCKSELYPVLSCRK